MLLEALHRAAIALLGVERRFDPFFRPLVDTLAREPCAAALQALIDAGRRDDGLALAQERIAPDEAAITDSIIELMAAYMRTHDRPGGYQRVGQTKTYGVVRGEVVIRDDVPDALRAGIFARAQTYPAWVRFSNAGPNSPPDIDDIGVVSIGVKLMGVPGTKLLDDERYTQDLLGVCTPTFVTPDTRANAKLQAQILAGTPLFYFCDPSDPHVLDALMQSLWSKTQRNPLGVRYYSCVPYLLGEGRAMQYSIRPAQPLNPPVPRVPLRPPDDYLRDAMRATLAERGVEFGLFVQQQTDPHAMPIENAAVRWPERLSPSVPVATLRIPPQTFDSPEQMRFAGYLSYNPWHALVEHRPLGSQNRARLRVYQELSRMRQSENATPHVEPTGDEVFA
jgi:hypothetical protein